MARRSTGRDLQDPAARKFHETERCELCGTEARKVAMDVHQASPRCEARRIQNDMRQRDWGVLPGGVPAAWAVGMFRKAGVEWYAGAIRIDRMGSPEFGIWAPAWACVLAYVVRQIDIFRQEQRFQRVKDSPELQNAVHAAWLLALEAKTDPVAAVAYILRVDSPELYPRR